MDKFTASNGYTVEQYIDRTIIRRGNVMDGFEYVTAKDAAAMEEYFQHKRDQELGRWRWPENPDYVVYPVGDDAVDVLRERSISDESRGPGRQASISREKARTWGRGYSQNFFAAARAYFAAHPVHEPWHDAKPGEVWVLTTGREGEGHAWMVDPYLDGVRFVLPGSLSNLPLDHPDITAGRRIWPEVSDGT